MANKFILFTLDGCSHCVDLKKQLIKENIEFIELEVGENKQIWNTVVEQTGHNSLPTMFVGLNGEDEGPIFVPERDYKSHEDLIEKIKIYT
jgi:glutaredoxin